jgi:hypothetical protein
VDWMRPDHTDTPKGQQTDSKRTDARTWGIEVALCSRIVRHPPYKKAAGGKRILSLRIELSTYRV